MESGRVLPSLPPAIWMECCEHVIYAELYLRTYHRNTLNHVYVKYKPFMMLYIHHIPKFKHRHYSKYAIYQKVRTIYKNIFKYLAVCTYFRILGISLISYLNSYFLIFKHSLILNMACISLGCQHGAYFFITACMARIFIHGAWF